MYSSITDHDDAAKKQTDINTTLHNHIFTFTLTTSVWISSILFAIFTGAHYIRHSLIGQIDKWNDTYPGLYRPQNIAANRLMILHFLAGIVLMTVGPVQLIPSFRRQFLDSHRLIGRIYIMEAMTASVCATLFVVIYGTSRGDRFEDAGNVLFGGADVFLCMSIVSACCYY